MIKKISLALLSCAISYGSFAQKADGTTKSLVNAEKEFAKSLSKDGAKKAFLAYSGNEAIVFRPNPISVKSYYATQGDTKDLTWKPVFAKMAKSADWGFTTGPYEFNGDQKEYGEYLSIWKVADGKWKLALDIGIPHNKPLAATTERFVEPTGAYAPKMFPEKDAAIGREIIMNTEATLNTTLKTYGVAAFNGFLNSDARLLFPGNEPIIGKESILAFNNRMIDKIALKTATAEKATSGELAYTFGIATIDYKADLRETFNYVFIWERQNDATWNIILQILVPAER